MSDEKKQGSSERIVKVVRQPEIVKPAPKGELEINLGAGFAVTAQAALELRNQISDGGSKGKSPRVSEPPKAKQTEKAEA